jgi:hypothetical protein
MRGFFIPFRDTDPHRRHTIRDADAHHHLHLSAGSHDQHAYAWR